MKKFGCPASRHADSLVPHQISQKKEKKLAPDIRYILCRNVQPYNHNSVTSVAHSIICLTVKHISDFVCVLFSFSISGNEAALGAAPEPIHRNVVEDGEKPVQGLQDPLQALRGYTDKMAHNCHKHCTSLYPHLRLTRGESTTPRKLQTNTYA